MTSWPCSHCTFLNPPTQTLACSVCLTPATTRQWPCRACTFSNPINAVSCEICGTRATHRYSSFDHLALDEDDLSHPSIGAVFRPLQRCRKEPIQGDGIEIVEPTVEEKARKEDEISADSTAGGFSFPPMQRCGTKRGLTDDVASPQCAKMAKKEEVPSTSTGIAELSSKCAMVKVLSYNVWFREDLEVHERMKALGDLIREHNPDIICFQEVTPMILAIFQQSNWWKGYTCSISNDMTLGPYFCMQMSKLPVKKFSCKQFGYSAMGRELCLAEVDAVKGKTLVVATSHLESPCPGPPTWDQMFSKERVAQAKESTSLLSKEPNVIFCGDMNWDDKLDGAFPMPDGWIDAWVRLKPGQDGWTYDTKANQMLSGNRKLQKRLDRFICSLRDFKVTDIKMIGMQPIPGISYNKEKKVKNEYKKIVLPVLPSDHFGLLLTITSK